MSACHDRGDSEAVMITFVCIICRLEQPRSMGKPVSDQKNPSWRCADIEACGARFLAGAR